MQKYPNLYLGILIAIVIAIGVFFSLHGAATTQPLGSSVNGGNVTDYTAVNVSAGYWVAGKFKIVDSSGNWVGNIASSTGSAIVGTFTQGGGITASSTSASVTLAGTEFVTSNVLDYTVNVGTPTLTLNASTTPPCSVMSAGQVRMLYIHNATTTAASTLTIAGGTGVILDIASTTVIAGSTTGKGFARLDFTKKANTDCQALMINFN